MLRRGFPWAAVLKSRFFDWPRDHDGSGKSSEKTRAVKGRSGVTAFIKREGATTTDHCPPEKKQVERKARQEPGEDRTWQAAFTGGGAMQGRGMWRALPCEASNMGGAPLGADGVTKAELRNWTGGGKSTRGSGGGTADCAKQAAEDVNQEGQFT